MPPLSAIPIPGPSPSSIRVADRAARSFPPLACVKGYEYFHKKRVDLVELSEHAIDAEVKGTRLAKVLLRVTGGRLAAACSCTAAMLGPAACKHVWATLLEIDRCGKLAGLRTSTRSLALDVVEKVEKKEKKEKKPSPPSPRSPRASAPPPAAPASRRRGPRGS